MDLTCKSQISNNSAKVDDKKKIELNDVEIQNNEIKISYYM